MIYDTSHNNTFATYLVNIAVKEDGFIFHPFVYIIPKLSPDVFSGFSSWLILLSLSTAASDRAYL
jgi:hypothetical protein